MREIVDSSDGATASQCAVALCLMTSSGSLAVQPCIGTVSRLHSQLRLGSAVDVVESLNALSVLMQEAKPLSPTLPPSLPQSCRLLQHYGIMAGYTRCTSDRDRAGVTKLTDASRRPGHTELSS